MQVDAERHADQRQLPWAPAVDDVLHRGRRVGLKNPADPRLHQTGRQGLPGGLGWIGDQHGRHVQRRRRPVPGNLLNR